MLEANFQMQTQKVGTGHTTVFQRIFNERQQEQARQTYSLSSRIDFELNLQIVAPARTLDREINAQQIDFLVERTEVIGRASSERQAAEFGKSIHGRSRWSQGRGYSTANRREGVEKKMRIELITQHFKSGFFFGEPGRYFLVELELVQSRQFGVLFGKCLCAVLHDFLQTFVAMIECSRAPTHRTHDAKRPENKIAERRPPRAPPRRQ